VAVLALAASHHSDPAPFEVNVFQTLNGLDDAFQGFFDAIYQLGTLWGIGLVLVAGLLARRWRLARDLALAGFVAWLVGRILASLIGDESVSDTFDVVVRAGSTPSFPLVRLAVITAIVAAAAPYLSRPTRYLSYVAVVIVTPAAMYLGVASLMDVVGGVALGVAVGCAVHLAFGSPGGRPTINQVALTLASLGVDADNLQLAPVQNLGRTLMLADGPTGPLDITVLGRDERDAHFASKAWRFLVYRDSGPTLFHSRLQEVEHEAYLLLRAEREGVAVPNVVEVGQAGPDAAVLVTEAVDGTPVADLSTEQVDDGLLREIWSVAAKLRDAGISHGNLDTRHLVVNAAGSVTVVGLRAGSSAAPANRLGGDVATLLYSTSQIVGDERAVAAATAVLGNDAMAASVPYIQPALVAREVRKRAKGVKKAFDGLRAAVAAQAGVEEPELYQLRRVSRRQTLMFAAGAFGIWFLIGMIGDPADLINELQNANWWWIALAFFFWILVEIGYAISMLGAIPPANDVPFGPLTLLQVASAFLNLITSGMIAQFVMNTRFLQKRGVDVPTAVSASAIPPIVYTVVQVVVILLTASAAKGQIALSDVGTGGGDSDDLRIVLIVLIAMVVGVGIVLAVPKLRNKVMPAVKTTLHNLWTVVTSPRKVAYIFGGSILTQLMYALILGACLKAYGADLTLAELLFVNTFVSLFGGIIPVPGGIGIYEAGLTAGLTAMGVDPTIATAAVLTDRMLTAYIPPVFGYISINWMTKHDYL
jgi:uncharacterized membrane protein YbhN (UPF0104 family)/tRNA A-37 threonylcarbamoyl transferase component Bud32